MPFSWDVWEIAAQESRIEQVDRVETLVLLNGSAVRPSAELTDGVLEPGSGVRLVEPPGKGR